MFFRLTIKWRSILNFAGLSVLLARKSHRRHLKAQESRLASSPSGRFWLKREYYRKNFDIPSAESTEESSRGTIVRRLRDTAESGEGKRFRVL